MYLKKKNCQLYYYGRCDLNCVFQWLVSHSVDRRPNNIEKKNHSAVVGFWILYSSTTVIWIYIYSVLWVRIHIIHSHSIWFWMLLLVGGHLKHFSATNNHIKYIEWIVFIVADWFSSFLLHLFLFSLLLFIYMYKANASIHI